MDSFGGFFSRTFGVSWFWGGGWGGFFCFCTGVRRGSCVVLGRLMGWEGEVVILCAGWEVPPFHILGCSAPFF